MTTGEMPDEALAWALAALERARDTLLGIQRRREQERLRLQRAARDRMARWADAEQGKDGNDHG